MRRSRSTRGRGRGGLFDARTGPSPSVRKFLKEYGGYTFESVTVCRKPIVSAINKIIDLVSNEKQYDKLYHLFAVCTLRSPAGNPSIWQIEKNHVVTVSKSITTGNTTCKTAKMSGTVGQVFERAAAADGKDFWNYDAIRANCQRFLASLLRAGGGLTPELSAFITQDVAQLLPGYAEKIAKAATNTAAWIDTKLFGKGLRGGTIHSADFDLAGCGHSGTWTVTRAREYLNSHGLRPKACISSGGRLRMQMQNRDFKRYRVHQAKNGVRLVVGHN